MDFAEDDYPTSELADKFRMNLMEDGLSRSHINNSCFAVKNFFRMDDIDWSFPVLKPNDGIPYYFDEKDVLAIFGCLHKFEAFSNASNVILWLFAILRIM